MAFLVTRRVAEECSTPAYQALTTVLRRPKASIATVMPSIVSHVRSLWRKAFLKMSFRMNIQNTFFQMLYDMGLFSSARVVRYHNNRLARHGIKALHQIKYLSCGNAVKITRRLICNEYGRIGYYSACYGDTLLLAAGELSGVVVHSVGKPYY